MRCDAAVLAADRSRRLGGVDKPLLDVGGVSLLTRAVHSARGAGATSVVVVGPPRSEVPGVHWVQEDPPGAGPAAAVMTAVEALDGDGLLLVLATDLPLARGAAAVVVERARAAVEAGSDGAMARADGRDQFLLLCARRSSLLRAAGGRSLVDRPMRELVEALDLARVDVPAVDVLDTDTWQAVVQARQALAEGEGMDATREWAVKASELAGVTAAPVDLDAILALARDAAHGIERPAAPVSTYLLGYAAGARGLHPAEIAALAAMLSSAALEAPQEGA